MSSAKTIKEAYIQWKCNPQLNKTHLKNVKERKHNENQRSF